jgi:polar amino acid transport system substrate-binding protein
VLERALRTGHVVMAGPSDSPPLVSLDAKGQPVGYAIELGKRIDAELRSQLGTRAQVRFEASPNTADTVASVASGAVDLACGIPFTWERDQSVDYSLPIALSGVRLLTRTKAIDGSPATLRGRRIAAIDGSVGASVLKDLQPAAVAVPFPSLEAAFTALQQGKVEGLIGDSTVLAGLNRSRSLAGGRLVPDQPYVTYGVGCIIPENNSGFANIVNLAIARLMAGYIEGKPDAVASVDPWVGPQGVLGIPAERIRAFYLSVLLSREGLQSQLLAAPAAPAPAKP